MCQYDLHLQQSEKHLNVWYEVRTVKRHITLHLKTLSDLSFSELWIWMACFKKAGRYLKTFSLNAPGGKPKVSKLLQKYRYKPKRISTSVKALIVLLIITRITLSIIPMDFHPWATCYSNTYVTYSRQKIPQKNIQVPLHPIDISLTFEFV